MIQKQPLLRSLALCVFLIACSDGNGTGGDGGSGGAQAPTAVITFPPAISMTEGDAVTVHGTAADDGTIASVSVNGVEASTDDGYATWVATVPLTPGMNTPTVSASDSESNSDAQAAEVVIERGARVGVLTFLDLDTANNRALFVDGRIAAVIAIDLTTAVRTVLSNETTPSASNPFSGPTDIAVDGANNRALVIDVGLDAVIAVDLTSGARTVLSDASTPSASNPFSGPTDIAVDGANNRAFVVDRPGVSTPSSRWI